MRKKDLFEQNTVLFNRLKAAEVELERYKKMYVENLDEIKSLRQALSELEQDKQEKAQVTEPEKMQESEKETVHPIAFEAEEKPQAIHEIPDTNMGIKLDGIMQFAAETIGKIVIEATKTANIFAQNPNEYSKDLLNLVLGKTEVCKSKIYEICNDSVITDKQREIETVKADAFEYFNNLTKQM